MSGTRMQIARLADGRLHLHDGPIDLVITVRGAADAIETAERAAIARFATVLDELCAELPRLRAPAGDGPFSPVARRMARAVAPFQPDIFITPMAAVAGSVADEILAAMVAVADPSVAIVNNGGDIAFHLGPGVELTAALIDRPDRPSIHARAGFRQTDPVRGVATSGWRGRSFSLGIADAVTVLAITAAAADAAATIIANTVDLPGHPAIAREPATDRQPDSDLGERMVTTGVGRLTDNEIDAALAAGLETARALHRSGLILGAALHLAGRTVTLETDLTKPERLFAHA